MKIEEDDLRSREIADLLQAHLDFANAHSPRESVHALDLGSLRGPNMTVWTAWDDEERLLGCVALKRLDARHGEVKSMHTTAKARGRGVAQKLLEHLLETARSRGMERLSLETGSMDAFAPARRLYERNGFRPCEPFDDYEKDPHSVFMTRALT